MQANKHVSSQSEIMDFFVSNLGDDSLVVTQVEDSETDLRGIELRLAKTRARGYEITDDAIRVFKGDPLLLMQDLVAVVERINKHRNVFSLALCDASLMIYNHIPAYREIVARRLRASVQPAA